MKNHSTLTTVNRLTSWLASTPSRIVTGVALLIAPAGASAQVTPQAADAFVESIGVNVHWGYTDKVYYTEFPKLKEKLKELGIRHTRDGSSAFLGKPTVANRISELYTDLGIRTTFITGRREGGFPRPLTLQLIDDELEDLNRFELGLIAGIEGPNEYNVQGNREIAKDVYEVEWVAKVKDYQRLVHDKAKNYSRLKNIPIIGPSFTTENAYKAVGDLDKYIDFSCIHAYQSWRNPGTGGYGGNDYGSITWQLKYITARQSPSGKPIQNTECGYNNDLSEGRGLPEDIQAKYLPRIFAEFFRRGVYRSFKYELIDQGKKGAEQVFGLLRNDISPKPVFFAVRDLVSLLNDPGEAFEPTALDYTLEGHTTNVREVLLQKRDGTYYLLLWLEVEGYNGDQDEETPKDPQRVTVRLPSVINQVTLHRQGLDGKMSDKSLTIKEHAVSLDVYDRMQVIELSSPHRDTDDRLPVAGKWYFVQNQEYGTRLETDACSDNSVVELTEGKNPDKQWRFQAVGDGYYTLENRQCSGYFLETDDCEGPIRIRPGASTAEDVQWKLIASEEGYFYLENKQCSKRLDADSPTIVDVDGGSNPDKLWKLIPAETDAGARTMASTDKASVTVPEPTAALAIYPNPAEDVITISIPSSAMQTVEVAILRASGQVAQRQLVTVKPGSNRISADVSSLPPGMYFVQLRTSSPRHTTHKLIIR